MKFVNDSFFDDLSNEKTQYVLGFLASDGCLSTNPKKKISFYSKDREILEKISLAIQTDYKIGFDKRGGHQIQIYSDKLFDMSLKLGIFPRKSLTINYPAWADRNFIRGVFDGDGSVHKTHNRPSIRCEFISGSRNFIIGLEKHLNILGLEYHYRYDDRGYFKLYIHRKSDILKFYDILYKNATIYLNRKLNVFQKWLQKTSNIGERPEKGHSEALNGRRDYQEVPLGAVV